MRSIYIQNEQYNYYVVYKKVKKLYFRYKAGVFEVTAPNGVSLEEIDILFIKHHRALLKLTKRTVFEIYDGLKLSLVGTRYLIKYDENIKKLRVENDIIYVNPNDPEKKVIEYGLVHLKSYVNERLPYFYSFLNTKKPLPEVKYRKVKTYYGKYYVSKNLISLNYNLIFMEKETIDYILVHELAHMIIPNHSKDFYRVVASIMPNYKEIIKKIKEGGIHLWKLLQLKII